MMHGTPAPGAAACGVAACGRRARYAFARPAGLPALRCGRHAPAYVAVFRQALRVAAVVGTLLFAINQAVVVLRGHATPLVVAKIALTYLVPFGVSTYSAWASTGCAGAPPRRRVETPETGGARRFLARPGHRRHDGSWRHVACTVGLGPGVRLDCGRGDQSDDRPEGRAMELRTRDVRGTAMRWHEQGAGEPVIFLHGIPTGPRLWRHVLPRLEGTPGVRALAWEMVGYGTSIPAGEDRDISVARQAEYLAEWMDALGIESAVLVGHDLGGGVAQIAAVRHPERVRGLVLMNAICYDSWPIPSVTALQQVAPLLKRLPDAAVWPILATLMARGHDDLARARESLRVHWQPYAASGGAGRALARQVRSLRTADTLAVADALPSLDLPAALVWGAADQFQKVGYGYRLAHDLGARLERVEGGRHFVPEDHPGRVAAAVGALLGPGGRGKGRQAGLDERRAA